MSYIVSMQEEDILGFSHSFTDEDAKALRDAEVGIQFELSNGFGTLFNDGDVVLTFRRGTGHRLHVLNYRELIRQFDQQDAEEPDEHDD